MFWFRQVAARGFGLFWFRQSAIPKGMYFFHDRLVECAVNVFRTTDFNFHLPNFEKTVFYIDAAIFEDVRRDPAGWQGKLAKMSIDEPSGALREDQ